MDANELQDLAKRYHDMKDFIKNEESAKMALVVPFIRALGYDPGNPREVRPEFVGGFTHNDGQKEKDRVDYAIFDKTGQKALIVFECKSLGVKDVKNKSPQLARYVAQMADLHFGIMTDGCSYFFYGDLENPNVIDAEPFFSFSLNDPKTDWVRVAKFLSKFSREVFNAETLVTDAENSRYRQAMIDRLTSVLRSPIEDEGFTNWLTRSAYKGTHTPAIKARLAELVKEAIEPAILRFMGDEFVEKLKERIQQVRENPQPMLADTPAASASTAQSTTVITQDDKKGTETTQEELDLFNMVRDMAVRGGIPEADVMFRDTTNYFNVSYKRPTKWFLRLFSGSRRRSITTLVPVADVKTLLPTFEVEDSPATFGVSRIYFDNIAQVSSMKEVILKSLHLVPFGRDD